MMRITSHRKLRRALRVASIMSLVVACTAAQAATPDLSGPWQVKSPAALTTVEGTAPPLLPAAQATYQANMAAKKTNPQVDPVAACLPPGVPRLMAQPMPFDIVQGRRTYAMMFEWNHLTRLVYMDREHFKSSIGPVYLGQSVGHWDGEVLVIDTNSFNDETWLDDTGLPHSIALHTSERIRLINGGRELEDRITFEDPMTFSQPWTARLVFTRKKGVLIKEDYCLGRTGHGTMSPP
jgi:hypothetical protein